MGDAVGNEVSLELLGTRGCHLCEQAEDVLNMAARAVPVSWRYVDIADNEALLAVYAERIPVLRKRQAELGWPFGVLDVLRFVRGESD